LIGDDYMRRFFATVLILLFSLALVALAVVNRDPVTVTFPMLEIAVEMPLHLVFFAGLILGVCLTGLAMFIPRLRNYMSRRRLEKRAKTAESRIVELEAEAPPSTEGRLAAIDRAQETGRSLTPRRSA